MNLERLTPHKRLVLFAIAFAAVAGFLGGPLFRLSSYCSVEPTVNTRTYHITEIREHLESQRAQAPKPKVTKSPRIPTVANLDKTTSAKTDYPAEIPYSFWRRFFCEVNGADYILAVFTIVLALSTIWLAWVTLRAVSLAREEFIASHRPKIRLRHLRFEQFDRDLPIQLSLRASNIGDGPATLVGIDIDLRVAGAIPRNANNAIMGADPATIWAGFPQQERIAAGGTAFVSIELPMIYGHAWYDPRSMMQKATISGKIVYRDDAGITRQTGFYRYCQGDPNRFFMMKWEDEAQVRDHEYED